MKDVKREGADIMVCLDVSNSMLAQDLTPNRLERSKIAIENMVNKLQGDRLGIIVFAGEAYVQLPITTDYSTAKLFLDGIDTKIVPTQGTNIADAINKAVESFGKDEGKNKAIVIITDGEENSSRFYTYHEIARMVKELDETGKWTFSFLGADLDAFHTSQMLNIRQENVISFSKSNYSNIMDDVSESIKCYANSKSVGNIKNNIFDIFDKKDRRES